MFLSYRLDLRIQRARLQADNPRRRLLPIALGWALPRQTDPACRQCEVVFYPATGQARTWPIGPAGWNVSLPGSECVAGRRSMRGELLVLRHRENSRSFPAGTHGVRRTLTSRRIETHHPEATHESLLRHPQESCLRLVF